ncbi:MAG TPA: hypothetical protein VFU26_02365 [Gaiellaceae bacterium]|nr:hypothetical protein [Gaiellaceae bacterium]
MKTVLVTLAASVGVALMLAAGAQSQHGPTTNHLLGPGAFGAIEFVGRADLTNVDDGIADVAVSPNGQWAFLANWGTEKCNTKSETGGQNDPDAGAYVIDISALANPRQVGFIPSHQDSRPGEGMQVVTITTRQFSGDMLVMNNEQCGKNGKGGVSLWDVTDPLKPVKLSEHFGDRGGVVQGDANDIHSSFAWDVGESAYLVIVDNFETSDVDILDITNPKRPRLIRELNLSTFAPGILQSATIPNLNEVFLHDIVVKQISGTWTMLLSYWDAGFVQLNVNDPASPTLIGDTDYTNPDPELLESAGISRPPEGNGHQAEFTSDSQLFVGTDEDFAPYTTGDFMVTSGPNAGVYPSNIVPGAASPSILPDLRLNGPTVYGGYGCPASAPIPTPASIPGYLASLAPGEEKIVVLQRGPAGDPSAPEEACFPGEKAEQAVVAGWEAVLFVQRHNAEENPPFCGSGAFVNVVVGVCTNHEAYHKLFNTPVNLTTYPDGPAIGTVGERISVDAVFDGWGYVHLFSNTLVGGKFAELDTYAITEAHQPAFATGFGALSVHEVATDPQNARRAYLSYYAGGIRALDIVCAGGTSSCELVEVGGYLDPLGNEFWGVEAFVRDGTTYILGSDMDDGLWIFRRKP